MSDAVELLVGQRQSSETDNAVIACNDWLRLGPGRSMPALAQKYAEFPQVAPPTKSLDTLKAWSGKFGWQARGAEYDATWEARKNEERQAELEQGLALDYERIRRLKRLADFLEAQLYERGDDGVYHNVWCPDVKQIGSGADAERVDLERFNGALIQQYRDVLDDLASEVGGRAKRVQSEVTGADGGPVAIVHRFVDMSDGELERLLK